MPEAPPRARAAELYPGRRFRRFSLGRNDSRLPPVPARSLMPSNPPCRRHVPMLSSSSAPPATSPTRRSSPRCRRWPAAGRLDVPVIGVAKSGWTREQLIERARASVHRARRGVDAEAFAQLVARLRYVDGDYNDPEHLRRASSRARTAAARPLHYLAIPPSMFPVVVEGLRARRLREQRAGHRREAVRPRPRLGARAEPDAAQRLPRSSRSSASTTTWARRRCRTSSTSASPTRSSSRSGTATTSRTCRSRWPRASA